MSDHASCRIAIVISYRLCSQLNCNAFVCLIPPFLSTTQILKPRYESTRTLMSVIFIKDNQSDHGHQIHWETAPQYLEAEKEKEGVVKREQVIEA